MKKMKIKAISILLIIVSVLSMVSCQSSPQIDDEVTLNAQEIEKAKDNEVRGIWISYSEIADLMRMNSDQSGFETYISNAFKQMKSNGFNTVYFHARAFSDAFYESAIFPSSAHITGKQGDKASFDMLKSVVKIAHDNSLKIEAWVNPYRVSSTQDLDLLADTNPAKKWLTDSDTLNDSWVIRLNDGGLYYNPAVKECIDLIVSGISEIVKNYDVDGVHFDDYFYPSTQSYIDEVQYSAYVASGGKNTLEKWRQDNVSLLIKSVYSAVKDANANVVFGVSPSSSIQNNLKTNYADLALWASEKGYVDYLCPQIYFGFQNTVQPFITTVKTWQSMMRKSHAKLYIGLALYKSGKVDEYADVTDGSDKTSPKYEFINNNDIISRQIKYLRQTLPYDGFAIFSYSYMYMSNDSAVDAQATNIKAAIA